VERRSLDDPRRSLGADQRRDLPGKPGSARDAGRASRRCKFTSRTTSTLGYDVGQGAPGFGDDRGSAQGCFRQEPLGEKLYVWGNEKTVVGGSTSSFRPDGSCPTGATRRCCRCSCTAGW
jgi:hypothetical protein